MEQLRLTLPELEQEEKQIRENLGGIVRNFVKTGWHLSRIDRSGAYKLKGYHSVTEYARETFGMAPDGVSRFIHVYEKYSIQGDSPELREEYRDFNFSQLTEMLQLPEDDHAMIRPETKREDIRDLKKFNKQSEHNPDNLLNWQQDPDDIIREAVKEFFKARKKDLNEIYDQYGVGPYPEEEIKKMARFLYHEKKKKFQTNRVFVMLYPDQVFIKSSDGELHDIAWPEFFQTMGSIFDGSAAGKDTWEKYFNPDPDGEFEEQIPGQDNIMNHPEYLPGKLHGRKFEHCIYLPEEDCISEDCGSCEKKKLLDQKEAREQSDSRSGHCLYKPDIPCTLTEGQKRTPGTGENCSQKCCWNCTKHGNCKLECVASEKRETKSEEIKELKKPDQEEKEYLDAVARHLIRSLWNWMREDHMNRVALVDKSPGELKRKLGPNGRTRWFATGKGTAHINMFDDYVQLWDEESRYMGDYDWFYLAAAIQSMWNVIALENAKKAREEAETEQGNAARDPEGQVKPELAPAQTETTSAVTADVKDIKTENLSLENLSIRINTDVWPEDLSDIPVPSELFIREYLEEEEKMLRDYLERGGLPERIILRQQLKVAGLRIIRNLVEDVLETEEEITQPELPRLKNNEERKEWLKNYQDWGLWYRDERIDVNYYKYDFKDGSRLVAAEYPKREGYWNQEPRDEHFFHFLKKNKKKYASLDETYDEKFRNETDSITSLAEFLKEIQK